MDFKLVLFVCIVSSTSVVQITGQDGCRPSIVEHLALRNDILTWERSEFEICDISHYILTVESYETNTGEYTYIVNETSFDLSFLPSCMQHVISVTQVSVEEIAGNRLFEIILTSPPPDADLRLQYVSLLQDYLWVLLQWGIGQPWIKCIHNYRVVSYDEDRDIPQDIYTFGNMSYIYVDPCTSYTFAVAALHSLEVEGPPSTVRHRAIEMATEPPTLRRLILHSTSIEMTWEVVPYMVLNRCVITSINVNSPQYFSVSFPVRDNPDARQPFSITVTGLTPDTMYFLNVTVTNSAGVSPPTGLFVQTLERD